VLLDGYDKLWKREVSFINQLNELRSEFPTKRRPPELGKSERLAPPTAEELQVIRRRLITTP
jgi:hypothetical protein